MPSGRATASSAPHRGMRYQFRFPTKFVYFSIFWKSSAISFVIAHEYAFGFTQNSAIIFVITLPGKKRCDYENNKWPSNRSKVEL